MSFINKLGKVLLGDTDRKNSHFNMSHSVNTTASIGDVFGIGCRYCFPDSKTEVEAETVIQLAPVMRPFMGKLGLDISYHFVEFADILGADYYKAWLTKTAYNAGGTNYVPLWLPNATLGALARWCLVGAQCSAYTKNSAGEWVQPSIGSTQADNVWEALHYDPTNVTVYSEVWRAPFLPTSVTREYFDGNVTVTLKKPNYLCAGFGRPNGDCPLPSAWFAYANRKCALPMALNGMLPAGATDRRADLFNVSSTSYTLDGHVDITPDTSDYNIVMRCYKDAEAESSGVLTNIMLCFKYSQAGVRFAKLLESCGYKVDMHSLKKVSLMPLFAHYFAYWSRFGVERELNYQNTNLCKLVQNMIQNQRFSIDQGNTSVTMADYWRGFLQDCSQMWYTDEMDYVSAHTQVVRPNYTDANILHLYATNGNTVAHHGEVPVYHSGVAEHGTINGTGLTPLIAQDDYHATLSDGHDISALDIEYLKRLYVWSNRNSIIGKRVDALLRAQGFGSWCDCQKSNYLGSDYIPIEVTKQMSMSDSYNSATGDGVPLGDYSGKAVGYRSTCGKHKFKASSFGYLVTLACIKVDAGYCQEIDGTLSALDTIHFPNQEFDGLGMECTPVDEICGVRFHDDYNVSATKPTEGSVKAFGMVPLYSKWKKARNIASGGFALRSGRSKYLPWHLDIFTPMLDKDWSTDGNGHWVCTDFLVTPDTMPKAGEVYRHIYRYRWLCNYNRIFANVEDPNALRTMDISKQVSSTESQLIDWTYHDEDNFIIQQYVKDDYWAPLKPINESFGTYDDEHTPNGSIAKV